MALSDTSSRYRRLVVFVSLCAFLVPLLVAWQARSSSAATSAPLACVAGDVPVSLVNSSFSPASVTILAGRTVCWTNNDGIAHTATSDTAVFASPTLNPGDTFRFTFNQGGTFPYHCTIHLLMRGSVRVLPRHP